MRLTEQGKIVEGFAPIDTTGAGQTGNAVCMKNYDHLTIIIKSGAWAGGTAAVTVTQATAAAFGDEKAVTVSYMWTNDGAATTDTLTKTAVTSSTFNVDTAASMYVIELDASELDVDNSFDWVRVNTATPGANADLIDCTYILTEPRYANASPPTALV